jgi:hypothetical protein
MSIRPKPILGRRRVSTGMDGDDWEVFPAELKRETDAAFLMFIEETEEEHWLPKSQCEWMEEEGQVWIPRWLAEKKGLV